MGEKIKEENNSNQCNQAKDSEEENSIVALPEKSSSSADNSCRNSQQPAVPKASKFQKNYNILAASLAQSSQAHISERSVKAAIRKGDIEKAVELSDLLAVEEAGAKRLQEIEAKKFTEKIHKANKRKIAKKRKKLNWTFETKKRWETKSNM